MVLSVKHRNVLQGVQEGIIRILGVDCVIRRKVGEQTDIYSDSEPVFDDPIEASTVIRFPDDLQKLQRQGLIDSVEFYEDSLPLLAYFQPTLAVPVGSKVKILGFNSEEVSYWVVVNRRVLREAGHLRVMYVLAPDRSRDVDW